MLNLGIIGSSPRNGHPYSWSAIINGFDSKQIQLCPYPIIPQYLSQAKYPDDFISNAHVSHIWTQEIKDSQNIAKFSKIPYICKNINELYDSVDAILLARDDYIERKSILEFLLTGTKPIFVDKPLAINKKEAEQIIANQSFPNQIFTCSSFRYSSEVEKFKSKKQTKEKIYKIDAFIQGTWDKYAIHLIEPVKSLLNIAELTSKKNRITFIKNQKAFQLSLVYNEILINFYTSPEIENPPSIEIHFKSHSEKLILTDRFSAFRKSLESFISGIKDDNHTVDTGDLFNTIDLIQFGT